MNLKKLNSFVFHSNNNNNSVKSFLNEWKTIYNKNKSTNENSILKYTINPLNNTQDIISYSIIHNENGTTDFEVEYKSGKTIKLIDCSILDINCGIHCNESHNHDDPTNLNFTFSYDILIEND